VESFTKEEKKSRFTNPTYFGRNAASLLNGKATFNAWARNRPSFDIPAWYDTHGDIQESERPAESLWSLQPADAEVDEDLGMHDAEAVNVNTHQNHHQHMPVFQAQQVLQLPPEQGTEQPYGMQYGHWSGLSFWTPHQIPQVSVPVLGQRHVLPHYPPQQPFFDHFQPPEGGIGGRAKF